MENFISPGLEARNVGTLQQQNIKEIKNLTLEEVIEKINAGDIAEPVKYTLALDTATSDKQLDIAGNFFGVVDASAADASISVKFNKNQSEAIDFTKGLYMTRPYNKVFLSWDAQAGESVDIIIASMNKDLFDVQDFRTEVSQAIDLAAIKDNTARLIIPSGATEVNVLASGTATATLYTVTAGKTLYIANASLLVASSSTKAWLEITTAADARVAIFLQTAYYGANNGNCLNYIPTIVVPAGYKIKIGCSGGNDFTAGGGGYSANINGWEI